MRARQQRGSRAWGVALAVLGALAGGGETGPNLRPHLPGGWSDVLVVSDHQGGTVDTPLEAGEGVYLDFAVVNAGDSAAASPFRVDLYLDGELRRSFQVPAPLPSGVHRYRLDYPLGRLGVGSHLLRLVVDAGEAVAESDETDNSYTRTLVVAGDCLPLRVRVSPPEAGRVTSNREATCGGSTVGIFGSAGEEEAAASESPWGVGGEPVREARRARALEGLRDRVRREGRVRVIVELQAAEEPGRGGKPNRRAIARASRSLLSRVGAGAEAPVRRFAFIPHVALEVDAVGLEVLARSPEVRALEEDGVVWPLLGGSTRRVGAPGAWSRGYAGKGQAVAILDTGVDGDHPFLAGRVVSEACYSGADEEQSGSLCPGGEREAVGPGSAAPCDGWADCYHGTAVAGVVAGKGPDFSGVAPEAGIIAIQVFSHCGAGNICSYLQGYDSDWIAGLERVLELSQEFDIAAVNMSFGREAEDPEDCDAESPAAAAALAALGEAGIAVVVAAGNEGLSRGLSFPACLSGAVSVGATREQDYGEVEEAVADFSNSGDALDLLAPGVEITTSVPGGGFETFNGTSLAAPHVAGAWALLKSRAPEARVAEVSNVLKATGLPLSDPRNDRVKPRLRVDAALYAAIPPQSHAAGTRLTLEARPRPGFRFEAWKDCDRVSGDRCVVTIDEARSVTALFEVDVPAPDLTLTRLSAPPAATAGGEVPVTLALRNQGPIDAGPFRVGLYLSADATVTPEDLWFAACHYPAGLAAGGAAECVRSFPLPLRVGPGLYTLGAVVDDLEEVVERGEGNNTRTADSGPLEILAALSRWRSFVPVVLSARGLGGATFTSELTLTNREGRPIEVHFTYTAHRGGGSGTVSDRLQAGEQKVVPEALGYLRSLGLSLTGGDRVGTLAIHSQAEVGVMVRTTTPVPEGRAGLAYPGIGAGEGFHRAVYLCGLRQDDRDRSNVAFQNMGTPDEGAITLRATVFSGDPADSRARVLEAVTLGPGEFHQYTGVLGVLGGAKDRQGYVRVERTEGAAPFYAYGVVNDQINSDGSFLFPLAADGPEGIAEQTLPVIVETGGFTSELTLTNLSEEARTLRCEFVAGGVTTPDRTARFSLRLEPGQQRILPGLVDWMRRRGVEGIRPGRGGLAGPLFVRAEAGGLDGIAIGARTTAPGSDGGRYGVFTPAVAETRAFRRWAWIDALQQNGENRSNLALVNTGTVDGSDSLFHLDLYDGDTGRWVGTVGDIRVPAREWRQINSLLGNHASGTRQGYVRIRQLAGSNPFLAYGVVNDGAAPGQRSGDGAFLPARK